jgi:tetratricopeptide (TPR) repeat protein
VNISPETAERRLLDLPIPLGQAELILGDRALAHEERSRAAEYFLAATKKDTLSDVAFYRLGMIEVEDEEYLDAISHLYRAYELQPANTQYQYQLAEAYIAKRWFAEAITELEDLTERYPMNGRYWQRLGFARNHSNRYAEAITAYERALSLDPDDVQNVKNLTSAVLNRAAELQMAGDLEGARKLYHQAKALYPDDWRATNNLIVMEIREGNIEQAHRMLTQALEEHPFAPNLNYNMGMVLEEMGKDREALEYYRKAAALDPLRSPAQNDIMRIEKKLMLEKEKKTP